MTALRAQGLGFFALAGLAVLAALALPPPTASLELRIAAVLIVLLGIPHGTLDTLLARRLYRPSGVCGWSLFVLGYCALGGAVVLAWWLAPGAFLVAFLLLSALHFAGDPIDGASIAARICAGGVPIVLPSLLHQPQIAHWFVLLVGDRPGSAIATALAALAWPWLIGSAAAVIWEALRGRALAALELGAAVALATLVPPLLAFALYFCAMHSARHILRAAAPEPLPPRQLALAVLPPLAGVVVLGVVGWQMLSEATADARLLQLIFVGLAALTAPHLVLVERIRLHGGFRGAPPQ